MKTTINTIPNELLSYEREQRHWTQDYVAEQIGAPDAKMVGKWERGLIAPSPHYRQQLETLFGKSARELGFVRKGELPFWNVPYQRNSFFTGQEERLAQIHATFTSRKTAAASPIALCGLGGVGKTQLAVEYAYRYQQEYHTIAWIHADTRESLLSDFAALALLLHLPDRDNTDQQRLITAVKQWLVATSRWLLIFDNVEDLRVLQNVLFEPISGHILLTTRSRMTGAIAHALEIETMGPDEGAYLLLRRSKHIALEATPAVVSELASQQSRVLSEMLGGLPLALDQAGTYIEETGCTLSYYLTLYQTRHKELLQRRGALTLDHPESVATTWSLSFDKIGREYPAAIHLLSLLAFLAPDAIPEELITQGAAELGPVLASVCADPLQLNQAIRELRKFSLIRRIAETKLLTLHRLVQVVLVDGMDSQVQAQWAERVVRATNRVFPLTEEFGNWGPQVWRQCERLLPQAFVCVALIEQWNMTGPEAAQLLFHLATYLKNRSHLARVEQLYQQALTIAEKTLGSEHQVIADYLYGLGSFYISMGQYAQSEVVHLRALRMRERFLGLDHPDIARSLQDLGTIFYALADYNKAEMSFQRSLHICQMVQPTPPYLAEVLNDLAAVYRKQGKYSQAEPLLHQALQLHEQQFGPEHSNMGGHLFNLASCYFEQGKYDQAEPLYQRALTIWEQTLGVDHADFAYGLRGLANLYTAQGYYMQAEPLYQQALTIFRTSLGPESVSVAHTLKRLADLYVKQKSYTQAQPLYQQALIIFETAFGPEHPNVVMTQDDLERLSSGTQNDHM